MFNIPFIQYKCGGLLEKETIETATGIEIKVSLPNLGRGRAVLLALWTKLKGKSCYFTTLSTAKVI